MKLFVGTRRKVGCGSMYGKWLDLDAFADEEEFLLACRKIHWEEKNPQFVFLWCKFIHGWELALFEKYSPPFGSVSNYLEWYCINELGYSTADLQGGTVDFGRLSENVACVDGYIFQS